MNVVVALRSVDEGFWSPTDDHLANGIDVDFRKPSWPISLKVGIHESSDEVKVGAGLFGQGGTVVNEGEILELAVGVSKTWKPGERTRLVLGGGASLVRAKIENRGIGLEDDDSSAGIHATAGVYWVRGGFFNVGIEARVLNGTDLELLGRKGDADYSQVGLLLGAHW